MSEVIDLTIDSDDDSDNDQMLFTSAAGPISISRFIQSSSNYSVSSSWGALSFPSNSDKKIIETTSSEKKYESSVKKDTLIKD